MKLTDLYSEKMPMRLAIFMSGTGSNAKKIIEKYLEQRDSGMISLEPALMFTDNPSSNAYKIAREDYKKQSLVIPLAFNPIKEFYKKCGCDNIKDIKIR